MLKLLRNRTKTELIRFFLSPISMLSSQRQRRSPIATEKYEHNTQRRFGQQNSELLPHSLKLNGNIFFELFLSDSDEKMTSAGYKRQKMALCNSSRNLFKNVAF